MRSAASSGSISSKTLAARSTSSALMTVTRSASDISSSTSASRSSCMWRETAMMRSSGRSDRRSAISGAFSSLIWASSAVAAWLATRVRRPVTDVTGTIFVFPASGPPRAIRTYNEVSRHSRFPSCSIATSSTTARPEPSLNWTSRSRISPSTMVSDGRFSKRRMLSRPVVMTWPLAIAVTRVSGMKTRRLPVTSTTSPTADGWPRRRKTTTTSCTLPTRSPIGS